MTLIREASSVFKIKELRKEVSLIRLQGNVLLFCLILLITGCNNKASIDTGLMSTAGPESFQQMIKQSETIVVVHKTGVDTIKSSENTITTIHVQFEVSEVLKGDSELSQQKINIETLEQLRAWRDEGQENYILFLEPHAAEAENKFYRIVGLTLGVLKIDQSNQVFWSKGLEQSGSGNQFYMDEEFRGLSLEDTVHKIKIAVHDN